MAAAHRTGDARIQIEVLDHLVLTVHDVAATCAFYARVLGMRAITFGDGRWALLFGTQKINLHAVGGEFAPMAARPTAGSGDLCFITRTPLDEVIAHIEACGVAIEEGPVERSGAAGPIVSVYLRDLDGNLIEIANRADQVIYRDI